MSKYSEQGSKTRDVGCGQISKSDRGESIVINEAKKGTVGIVGDKGIAPGGLPVGKGGK